MRTLEGSSPAPISPVTRSPWHSPVPYLFDGLAAMLGLIAFALLILACSYWRLSGYLENSADNDRRRDLEAGDGEKTATAPATAPAVFEEKFVVIMAGQENTTFIATPVSSRTSSFGSNSSSTLCSESSTLGKSEEENDEEKKQNDNVSQVEMVAVGPPQGTDN